MIQYKWSYVRLFGDMSRPGAGNTGAAFNYCMLPLWQFNRNGSMILLETVIR